MRPDYKKTISITAKTIIIGSAFAFIVHKLEHNQNLENFSNLVSPIGRARVALVVGAIGLLMLVNWLLEALKWKFLLAKIEPISTWRAIESVFCGLTWAVFTPNRIGEFGGRVFFLPPRKRLTGTVAMSVGAVGQIVTTNVLGGISVLWFIGRFIPLNIWLHYAIAFITAVFCAFFLLLYFNIRLVNNFLVSIPFLHRFKKVFRVLTSYKKGALVRVFGYCVGRFAVFTTQYYLVIHLLVPDLAATDVVLMVFVILFVQSAIPSFDLFDIGIRSMTATYFFGYITPHDLAIMASTAFIWLVNLIIPAILGSVFVLKIRFFDSNH